MYTFFVNKNKLNDGLETHIFKLYAYFLNENAVFYVKIHKKRRLY